MSESGSKHISSRIALNNGVDIPFFGLGVYLAKPGPEALEAVKFALSIGYRLIDTARMYENESDVGKAVRESSVPRQEIFVTTKLWNSDHGYDRTLKAFDKSLKTLGLKYIDLYLIHWPVEDRRRESWQALETLLEEGRCRSIGVSNYQIGHLQELLEHARYIPAINQVEFNPFLYQRELLEFCRGAGIQLQAYCPLTRGRKFSDETLVSIANVHHKTPAQILIRWALEHDVVVIPKSSRIERIRENAGVFDFSLSPAEMTRLDSLHEDLRVCWDPTTVR